MPNRPFAPPELAQAGTRVRQLRQALGWTQERLAIKAGIPTTRLKRWEQGTADMGLLGAHRLALALNVQAHVLLQPPESLPDDYQGRGRPRKRQRKEG